MIDSPLKQNKIVSLDTLVPHPRNYHVHPQIQIDSLVKSLQRFGQGRSIVVQDSPDKLIIVAGHGIVEAAQALKWKELRADILPADWTEAQIEGYLIADNEHSKEASDNEELLAMLLREQQDAGFDLASLGTDDEALRQMLESLGDEYLAGDGQEGAGGDDFDVTPEEGSTRTHVGELWQLGKHRLLVGDCTDVEDVRHVMQGESADCIFTDPPYNVDVAGGTHDPRDKKNFGKGPRIQNDLMDDDEFKQFLLRAFKNIIAVTCPGASIYVCHADTEGIAFRTAFVEAGWNLAQCLIWAKQQFVFGRSDYHWQHEPILYGCDPGAGHDFYGERNQSTVWNIDRPMRSDMEHPTAKPLELLIRAITNSSKPGDIVLDGFAGTGTTLTACQRLGRIARLVEIDPRYADVILRRYEAETGHTA